MINDKNDEIENLKHDYDKLEDELEIYDEKLSVQKLYYKEREVELNESIKNYEIKNKEMIIIKNNLNESIEDKNNKIEELKQKINKLENTTK